jgi:sulfide dehydrogenase [flavocytochrome c] flavoprotein chain
MAGVRSDSSGTWCPIDYRSFESLTVKNVHVLGDSTLTNFPKSGSVANNTGKMAPPPLWKCSTAANRTRRLW